MVEILQFVEDCFDFFDLLLIVSGMKSSEPIGQPRWMKPHQTFGESLGLVSLPSIRFFLILTLALVVFIANSSLG